MDSEAGVIADGQAAVHNGLTGAKQKLRDGSVASIPEFLFMGRETAGLAELSKTLGKAASVKEIPTVVFAVTNDRHLIRFSAVLAFTAPPFARCLK